MAIGIKTFNRIFGFVLIAFVAKPMAADTLLVFQPHDTARAQDVNANFKFLMDRINGLATLNQVLKKTVDSIAGMKPMEPKIDSINSKFGAKNDSINSRLVVLDARITLVPKGTVIASMIDPAADGYLPNSEQTWLLAAGQGPVNGVSVPDLRGVFVRGVDYTLTGNPANGRDSTSTRIPGSFQGDILKSHSHGVTDPGHVHGSGGHDQAISAGAGGNGPFLQTDNGGRNTVQATTGISIQGEGGLETRPKNIALFYYIKVK